MGITDRLRLFVSPWMIVRHKSKPNIQRPRHPHWERLKMLRGCQPIFQMPFDENPKCGSVLKSQRKPPIQEIEEYPYAQILAKILFHSVQESRMVAVFHRNSIGMADLKTASNALSKEGMKIVRSNKVLAKMAFEGTKYEGLLHVLGPHTTVVTSPEPRVDRLFRLVKKMPQLVLLGGIVEDRLMSKEDMEAYGNLPDMGTARGQLVAVLRAASSSLPDVLTAGQRRLVRLLDAANNIENK